jgi:hypothetical protein
MVKLFLARGPIPSKQMPRRGRHPAPGLKKMHHSEILELLDTARPSPAA